MALDFVVSARGGAVSTGTLLHASALSDLGTKQGSLLIYALTDSTQHGEDWYFKGKYIGSSDPYYTHWAEQNLPDVIDIVFKNHPMNTPVPNNGPLVVNHFVFVDPEATARSGLAVHPFKWSKANSLKA
eukprot:6475157-Amphidinium_carterae.1